MVLIPSFFKMESSAVSTESIPLILPSPPAYRQASAGERDRVRGNSGDCNEI